MADMDHRLPLNEGHAEQSLSIKCLKIEQPIGCFFIGSIRAQDLTDITYSDVRRIHGERGFETYLGIQRPLNSKRVTEISNYAKTADACFPTAVILSVDEKCAEFDAENCTLTLKAYKANSNDPDDLSIGYEYIAKVIDGQHRIEGLAGYQNENFYVNVSIFIGIDVASEAYIFSTVNLAQTKVNKSLVYDLYELAENRSPQKLCHNISVTLDSTDGSPFRNKIKRLGSAGKHNIPSSITQAAFVESLIKYLSKDPLKDRDLYIRGKKLPAADLKDQDKLIFRDFMIDERDYELTDIIWNFFEAAQTRWPKAWNSPDQGIMLSKTNGFMALMRFLHAIYNDMERFSDVPTIEEFLLLLNKIDLDDSHFSVDNYKPGSSGEGAMFRDLKEKSGLFS